jgi:hypothetical protein
LFPEIETVCKFEQFWKQPYPMVRTDSGIEIVLKFEQ